MIRIEYKKHITFIYQKILSFVVNNKNILNINLNAVEKFEKNSAFSILIIFNHKNKVSDLVLKPSCLVSK